MGARLNSQYTLQVLPQNSFFLVLSQAGEVVDPLHRRIKSHVVGPIAAQEHPVNTRRVNDVAQSLLTVGHAVIVKAVLIFAGRLFNVDSSLGAHLPPPVHTPRSKTGEPTAVGQTQFQVRKLV